MAGNVVRRSAIWKGVVYASLLGAPLGPIVSQTVAAGTIPEANTLTRTVTVSVENARLVDVLQRIAKQAGLTPFYSDTVMRSLIRVSLRLQQATPVDAFEQALRGTAFRAIIDAQSVAFGMRDRDGVTSGSVIGRVVDAATKHPLHGAIVTLAATNRGVTTNDEGAFRLQNLAPGSHVIHVRLLGYTKVTRTVVIMDGQTTTLEIAMEPSVNALDQVVVTGTVAATAQREVPNAMTVITAKDLQERGITRIEQLFRGDVPGLFAMNIGSSNALDQVTMFSRGATSLGTDFGTTPIKTYLDGVELADPSYLSQIDPQSIERIEIVTGPQASTIYGSNAINGVMQVFTKRGIASRPQVTATLLTGFVQNNFSSALTPQHDDAAQVNGTDGHLSYNAGASWIYMGPWTPGKQTSRVSGFGGVRMQRGPVTADASIRLATTKNQQNGASAQTYANALVTGLYTPIVSYSRVAPSTQSLVGQTLGLTMGYAPVSWGSLEVVLGSDQSATENRAIGFGYTQPSDTLLTIEQTSTTRRSIRSAVTVQAPIGAIAKTVVTVGADAWQNLASSLTVVNAPALTGTVNGTSDVKRQPDHNAGGFVQAQLGVWDAVFLTYGLRAEWNSEFGESLQPNWSPRYGIAYTRELDTPLGSVTAKLRASYGRSTRPPNASMRAAQTARDVFGANNANTLIIPYYGNFDYYLANPDLGPEHQEGGEGGAELYFGRRGSLVVTRYNQVVNGLLAAPQGVDSMRSFTRLPPLSNSVDADGYGYLRQYQYLNIGSVRNQGWELQGLVNLGPLGVRGTYSWTKSRLIGVDARYQAMLTGSKYQPGASFQYVPEHTWATGFTYARVATMVGLNITGTGMLRSYQNEQFFNGLNSQTRLAANRLRMNLPTDYAHQNPGYVLADLNATQRFATRVEGVLQVQNIGDFYRSDYRSPLATLGRQVKLGVRLR